MMMLKWLGASLIALLVSAAAFAAESCTNKPPMQVGDTFEMSTANGGKFTRTVTEATGNKVVWEVGGKSYAYDRNMNLVVGIGPRTGMPMEYNPPMPRFVAKMCPGMKFGGEYSVTWRGGGTRASQFAEVGNWETFKAPWGEERVLPIKYTSTDDVGVAFPKVTITTCLYSPEANELVQCSTEGKPISWMVGFKKGPGHLADATPATR